MKRLLFLVEGQTEEVFVRDVLTTHLENFGISCETVLLKTKRVKAGASFKGGVTTAAQVLGDVRRLLNDSAAAAVTTIIDYYGLPPDFPGMAERPPGNSLARVTRVEAAFEKAIDARSFIPHLTLHEYEAWIFSDTVACSWVFDGPPGLAKTLAAIATTAGGAECINEQPSTAPSKRLVQEYPGYRKTFHGPMAVAAIGLAGVRQKCPHADAWLRKLEAL